LHRDTILISRASVAAKPSNFSDLIQRGSVMTAHCLIAGERDAPSCVIPRINQATACEELK
jgi:hypothetical protein